MLWSPKTEETAPVGGKKWGGRYFYMKTYVFMQEKRGVYGGVSSGEKMWEKWGGLQPFLDESWKPDPTFRKKWNKARTPNEMTWRPNAIPVKKAPYGVDAAVYHSVNGATYFFKGKYYIKFNGGDFSYGNAVEGYPKEIKGAWGIPDEWAEEGIDAIAPDHHHGEFYFFKGDEYCMVKMNEDVKL